MVVVVHPHSLPFHSLTHSIVAILVDEEEYGTEEEKEEKKEKEEEEWNVVRRSVKEFCVFVYTE